MTSPDDTHACRPDATVYYCPTASSTESNCHGGFDVCCAHPDLHQQLLACSLAHCRQAHAPHSWEPQPGMQPVHCEGFGNVGSDELARLRHEVVQLRKALATVNGQCRGLEGRVALARAALDQVRAVADALAAHGRLGVDLEADSIRRGIAHQIRAALTDPAV
ncbi:hypothetical protein [Streptomyces sp. NPDC086838]|uniref:hypothetical protein n=1 Tax=Streptomyces sp. NPDC086838 TaxID=3365762 RepID=UPI003811BAF9